MSDSSPRLVAFFLSDLMVNNSNSFHLHADLDTCLWNTRSTFYFHSKGEPEVFLIDNFILKNVAQESE